MKRIALVPYKPGQEPEGMVSSLDPEQWDVNDGSIGVPVSEQSEYDAMRAAIKAAKRDERIRTLEEFKLRFMPSLASPLSSAEETLREMARALGVDYEPESAEDVPSPEERNRRQRAGLCRLCGGDKGGNSFWCGAHYSHDGGDGAANDDWRSHREEMDRIDKELRTEAVPELWVSRDASCPGDWSDLWTKGKPVLDDDGQWLGPLDNSGSYYMPTRLSRVLGLGPGDCRRVTADEYRRYFREVLDLPPSERCAALERMVP